RAANHAATGNAWVVNDLEWTGLYSTSDHFASPILRQILAPDALPSIGTCSPTTVVPVLGHMAEFDTSGTKGIVYITEISIHLQEITSSVEVNMNNIALTEAAYSIAMGATGYIIDQNGRLASLIQVFDTSTRTWSGPNLTTPGSTMTNNIAIIAGDVVGGVVLLALLSFFGFRRWQT
ncbi:hypothetical protein BGW42_006793, partial [Actinomortierella wolfii]